MSRSPSSSSISLVPQTIDLALYAGDGVSLRLIVNDPTGSPIDISGDITAQIRDTREAFDSMADFDVDDTDAADGIVLLSLTGDQTTEFHAGTNLPITVKGTVAAVVNLPSSNNSTGEQYIVTATSHYYRWSGTAWEDKGPVPPPVPLLSFEGVWDCQWVPTGSSLPLTLVQGNVTSVLDVTRVNP